MYKRHTAQQKIQFCHNHKQLLIEIDKFCENINIEDWAVLEHWFSFRMTLTGFPHGYKYVVFHFVWCDLKQLEDEDLCHGDGDSDENLENCQEFLFYLEWRKFELWIIIIIRSNFQMWLDAEIAHSSIVTLN